MSDRSYTQAFGDKAKGFWNGIKKFLDQYDAESWPAFLIFFAVITLGMILNYIAFQEKLGKLVAAIISLLFEVAILSWKLTGNRKRNDAKQNQITQWATWLSVILALCMVFVNLFRVGAGSLQYDDLSYIIVGAACLVQIVAYLVFSNADPDLEMTREHNQAERDIKRRTERAKNVIGELKADVDIIRFITQELERIQRETKDLPPDVRETLLAQARSKLLAQYGEGKSKSEIDDIKKATESLVDLNGITS